ncbi:MAG: HlyC/CorC family transporter [Deltaproteobacteria bacterium]|nr:HlyC/CorC family transporter [Deltaproteobacteria bacterium]
MLILANGFFAGAEIAVVALRKARIQELAEGGHRGAAAVLKLRQDPERFLATVQIGITVVGATAAAFGGASIAARLRPVLEGVSWLRAEAGAIALALVVGLISYLSIVLGELVPKSLALKSAERFAISVARPLAALSWFSRPLVWFLSASANVVLRPFGDRTTFTETRHSAEELQDLVEEAAKAGSIHPAAGEIASRALDFSGLSVADVMVPRQDVVMIPRGAPQDEIRRLLLEHTHNRMPIFEDRIDNVVGYVNVRDLLAVAWEQRLIVLEDVTRPAWFVPESMRAVDLLHQMQLQHLPFAIVVDEYGGTSGIVTMEDLVEELVGEIFSEYAPGAAMLIKKELDGSAIVAGTTPIRDVNRELGIELPEGETWSTLAGLVLELSGRVPVTGESIQSEGGITLEVVDSSPRRVRAIRIRIPADATTTGADGDGK